MRRARLARIALVLGTAVALSATAAAQPSKFAPPVVSNYGENETTRSSGMGGALRALGSGTTAMLLNPAALPMTRLYHLEAQAQLTPETARQVYGGTIVDSVTSRLAGGVSFMGGFMDPDGLNRTSLDLRFALAYPLGDRFFIGVDGRYLKVTQAGPKNGGPGPFGNDKVSGGLRDDAGGRDSFVNQLNFDAGIVIKATDSLYLAVLGQNLAYANNGVLPTLVGGGFGIGTQDFSIEVDGIADFNSWATTTARMMAGAEYLIANHVPVRLGYKYDSGAKLNTLSFGTGFVTTDFSIEASVKRTISDPGTTTIVVGLAYFLESSGLTKKPRPEF